LAIPHTEPAILYLPTVDEHHVDSESLSANRNDWALLEVNTPIVDAPPHESNDTEQHGSNDRKAHEE